jgi:hypothetical protein
MNRSMSLVLIDSTFLTLMIRSKCFSDTLASRRVLAERIFSSYSAVKWLHCLRLPGWWTPKSSSDCNRR